MSGLLHRVPGAKPQMIVLWPTVVDDSDGAGGALAMPGPVSSLQEDVLLAASIE